MTKRNHLFILLISAAVVTTVACGDDDDSTGGTGGSAGISNGGTVGSAGTNHGGSAGVSSGGAAGMASGGAGPSAGASSGGTAGTAGTTGGTAGTTGGSAGVSAGGAGGTTGGTASTAGGSGGATSGAGGAAVGTKVGAVSLGTYGTTTLGSSTAYINSASAQFVDTNGASNPSCTTIQEGSCAFVSCDSSAGSGGSSSSGGVKVFGAGDITLTGAQVSPIVLSFSGGSYKLTQPAPGDTNPFGLPTDKPIINGGETVEVKAVGDAVPGFTLSGKAPASPTVSGAPMPTAAGMPTDIETTSDIHLSITGSGDGYVEFYARSLSSTKLAEVACVTTVTSPSLMVPASHLQKIRDVNTSGFYSVTVYSTTKAPKAGDWDVSLTLVNTVKGPDGKVLAPTGNGSTNATFK